MASLKLPCLIGSHALISGVSSKGKPRDEHHNDI